MIGWLFKLCCSEGFWELSLLTELVVDIKSHRCSVSQYSVECEDYRIRPIKEQACKLLGGFYSLLLVSSEFSVENAFLIKLALELAFVKVTLMTHQKL